jgi:hypothetical protein
MSRPLRRYLFSLAERLSMPVKELEQTLTLDEVAEWLAYDLSNSDEWLAAYMRQKELEASRKLSREQQIIAFKRLLGDTINGNDG